MGDLMFNIEQTKMSNVSAQNNTSVHLLNSAGVPFDENLIIINTIDEIPTFGDPLCKGGIYRDALPSELKDELLGLSLESKLSISDINIDISPTTGSIVFPKSYRDIFSDLMLDFIETFTKRFNEAGDWQAEFKHVQHLDLRQKADSFHPDSWSASDIRQYRAFINVSSDDEGQKHETELLMTDGLTQEHVRETYTHLGHHKDLPEIYDGRVELAQSGDAVLVKGLGDGESDTLTQAFIHRGPPHKKNYPEEGKQRDALIWQRKIEIEPDLG